MLPRDYKTESKKYGIGGGGIYNLEAGENKFRLLSELEPFIQHFIKEENRFVNCDDKRCEHCKAKINKSSKVVAYILDRTDDKIKLAKLPWAVYTNLGDLSGSSEWGFTDLPLYDLLVLKRGEGKSTRYSVNGTRNDKPLTLDQSQEFAAKRPVKEVVAGWIAKSRDNAPPPYSEKEAPAEEIDISNLPF